MNGDEVRRIAREKIKADLFGEEFRTDDPLNTMGGLCGQIINQHGIDSFDKYMATIGGIRAMKRCLDMITDAYREANGLEPTEEN